MKASYLVMLSALVLAAPAQAVMISQSSVGDSFTIEWLLADGATDSNGNTNNTGQDITAEAVFELTAFDIGNDSITLSIMATNTTAPNDDEIGLWKIGFGTDPDATGVDFLDENDGAFDDATMGSFPAFPNSAFIDVTSSTDPGAKFNLQAQESDEFDLDVSFADLTDTSVIRLEPFDAFFQGDPDSYQFGSTTQVPAPTPLALLGIGLIGLVAALRRARVRRL